MIVSSPNLVLYLRGGKKWTFSARRELYSIIGRGKNKVHWLPPTGLHSTKTPAVFMFHWFPDGTWSVYTGRVKPLSRQERANWLRNTKRNR